jgi:Protein of unknown function (DUF3631).
MEELTDSGTIRQTLLEDIRGIIEEKVSSKVSSKELVEKLVELEDHPWSDWRRGKPVTQNGLARLLKPFGVTSNLLRVGEDVFRGYSLEQFSEVFTRYLPPTPVQSVTKLQATPVKGSQGKQNVTQNKAVTLAKQHEATPVKGCNSVTLEKRGYEGVVAGDASEDLSQEESKEEVNYGEL